MVHLSIPTFASGGGAKSGSITQPTSKGKWLSCFVRFQYSYQPEISLRTSVRISWYLWILQSLGHWGQMKTNRKFNFVIDDDRTWSEYIQKMKKVLYLGLEITMGRTSNSKIWSRGFWWVQKGLLFDDMSCFDWSFCHALASLTDSIDCNSLLRSDSSDESENWWA